MRCCDVERLWDEMREGVEPRREHVMAHLRGCPECQEIYRENEGIAYCLTCLPPVDPPQSMVRKILDHIKATVKIATPDSIATVESPIGRLYVAFRHSGITAIALDRGEGEEAVLAKLQRRLGRGLIPSQAPQWVTDTVAAFFRTHKTDLEKVDISELTPFEQSALRAAATIPPGEVRSYTWIAEKLGQPTAGPRRRPRDGPQSRRAAVPVPSRRRRDRRAAPVRLRRRSQSAHPRDRRVRTPRPPLTSATSRYVRGPFRR